MWLLGPCEGVLEMSICRRRVASGAPRTSSSAARSDDDLQRPAGGRDAGRGGARREWCARAPLRMKSKSGADPSR
jgi:hypothetical protein